MAKEPAHKGPKTNAMRVLDAHHVAYEAHYYPATLHVATEVAAAIGAAPGEVFKTLVVLPESGSGRPLLVVVPSDQRLDLKALGVQPEVGEKRLRMATQREAERLTGLLVGGISPLRAAAEGLPHLHRPQRARPRPPLPQRRPARRQSPCARRRPAARHRGHPRRHATRRVRPPHLFLRDQLSLPSPERRAGRG